MKRSDVAETSQNVGVIGGRAGPTAIFISPAGSCTWQEYALSGTVALGWLLPLIVGMCLWRRCGMAGRVLVGLGAVWGVVALVYVGWFIWMFSSNSAVHVKTFDPVTYRGAVGTVVFAYDGEGDVIFQHSEPDSASDKKTWWHAVVANGSAKFPAGRIEDILVHFFVTNAWCGTCMLSWDYTKENRRFTLDPGERHEIAGGFPLTASISVEGGFEDGQCVVEFSMADTAGNHVVLDGGDHNPLDIPFEAVAPDGTCFWRGRLGNGYSHEKIPADAPPTFIIRPVCADIPLDIRIEETRVSRDELLRETLKHGEKWLKEDGK